MWLRAARHRASCGGARRPAEARYGSARTPRRPRALRAAGRWGQPRYRGARATRAGRPVWLPRPGFAVTLRDLERTEDSNSIASRRVQPVRTRSDCRRVDAQRKIRGPPARFQIQRPSKLPLTAAVVEELVPRPFKLEQANGSWRADQLARLKRANRAAGIPARVRHRHWDHAPRGRRARNVRRSDPLSPSAARSAPRRSAGGRTQARSLPRHRARRRARTTPWPSSSMPATAPPAVIGRTAAAALMQRTTSARVGENRTPRALSRRVLPRARDVQQPRSRRPATSAPATTGCCPRRAGRRYGGGASVRRSGAVPPAVPA